jgi:predicted Fe-Mo cluster-binding NifX family protein
MIYTPSSEGIRNVDVALLVLCLTALPIILFSRYEARRAKALNSPSLTADAENWRADLAPLLVVAAGIAGSKFSYPVMDRIAAALVLVMVLKAGYGILKDSVKSLLDASVDRATLDTIKGVIQAFPQVTEIVSLQARNSGRFIFVDTDVRLSLKRLKEAHSVAESVEREIKGRVPFIERVNISYEPEKKDCRRCAVPLAVGEGEISDHFAKAPFIAMWDSRKADGTIVSYEVVENPFLTLEKGKGIQLAELLVKKGVDILFTREDFKGKGPEHVFSDAGVDVRKTDLKNLKELMEPER